jgi:hypothetical protein
MTHWSALILGALLIANGPVESGGEKDAPGPVEAAAIAVALERMESAGRDLVDLSGKVTYRVQELIVEDEDDQEFEEYQGEMRVLRKEGVSKTWVHFKTRTDGTVLFTDDPTWYLFDGRILYEAREKERKVVTHNIVKDGPAIDPFRLGQGPFPLPFGQTQKDMESEFEIRLLDPGDLGAGWVRVEGKPRAHSSLHGRYRRIVIDVAPDGLPRRIELDDVKDLTRKSVRFGELKKNTGLKKDSFELPRPASRWDRVQGSQ